MRNQGTTVTTTWLAIAALVGCTSYSVRRSAPGDGAAGGAGASAGGTSPVFGGSGGPSGGSFGVGAETTGGAGGSVDSAGQSGAAGTSEVPREPCALGSFVADDTGRCQDWKHCEPGRYVSQTPSSRRDRECSACPSGTFAAQPDSLMCLPWSACAAGVSEQSPPSARSDRVCSCANGGEPVTLLGGVSRCRCPFGTWGEDCSLTTLAVNAKAGCAVRSDHRLACWSGALLSMSDYQFASIAGGCGVRLDGSLACSEFAPANPPSGSFQSVSTGASHACALAKSGAVTCWGDNTFGQLDVPPGRFISLGTSAVIVHAVREDGALVTWGAPNDGAAQPPAGEYQRVVDGWNGSCGIKADGSPACWYTLSETLEQAGAPARVADISVGGDRVCWLSPEGMPGCSGGTSLPGGPYQSISLGERVCGITTGGELVCDGLKTGDLGPFVDLTTDTQHGMCGLTPEGRVACPNAYDPPERSPGPWTSFISSGLCGKTAMGHVECDRPLADPALEIAIGYGHTCRIRVDGALVCSGDNLAASAPPPPGKFVAVSAGFYASCAIRDDGRAICWSGSPQAPLLAPAGQFSAIHVGYSHDEVRAADFACGILLDGTLKCWGDDAEGRATPPLGRYFALSVGWNHGCALSLGGELACWGNVSELGPLPSGTFTRFASGARSLCLLRRDGRVQCAGDTPYPSAL